jgi:hypothetical protein
MANRCEHSVTNDRWVRSEKENDTEFTGFEKIGTMGSSDPYFIGWLNFKFGIRYNLKN